MKCSDAMQASRLFCCQYCSAPIDPVETGLLRRYYFTNEILGIILPLVKNLQNFKRRVQKTLRDSRKVQETVRVWKSFKYLENTLWAAYVLKHFCWISWYFKIKCKTLSLFLQRLLPIKSRRAPTFFEGERPSALPPTQDWLHPPAPQCPCCE